MTLRSAIIFCLLFIWADYTFGQVFNLGAPPVNNFSSKTYQAATQNWDVVQDETGKIYVANNIGMLEFDGFNWRIHPIGNGTIVRSLMVSSTRKIFAGGQGDFGYFEPDEQGILNYHSLAGLLADEQTDFGDVWDIIERPEGIFFRTNKEVFFLLDGRIKRFEFDASLNYMGLMLGQLFVQQTNGEFLVFENGSFKPSKQAWNLNALVFEDLNYHPDTTLLITNQKGIYYFTNEKSGRWETDADQLFMDGRLYCASILPDGMIAIGSTNNGLFILDSSRRISQHLNKRNGLQNNTVLSVFTDFTGDLWLGLDNGIDLVKTSSPYTTIYPDGDLEGTGYGVEIFEGKLFFGTNTGLYFIPLQFQYSPDEKRGFQLVPGTEGQVWSLQVLEDELLIGHHNGGFSLRKGRLRKLTDFLGVWRFLSIEKGRAIAGHYNGLALFEKQNDAWNFVKMYDGLTESSRLLAPTKDGGIWMAHPYRGIFKINFDETDKITVKFFGKDSGLPSDLGNHVFSLNNQSVVTGNQGVFEFNVKENRFEPAIHFNEVFGANTRLSYIRQDEQEHIWFISREEVGALLVENTALEKKVTKLEFPELAGRPMNGFEFIFPMDKENAILATEQGFEHFNLSAFSSGKQSFNVILHEVVLEEHGDSLLYGGNQRSGIEPIQLELDHQQNNLRFVFGSTDFHGKEFVKFAHRTQDDEEWTDWASDNRLIFNNLTPGEYNFQLKAKNRFGEESEVLSFPFKISPPWYTSTWAKVIYWILLLTIFMFYLLSQRRTFENEKAELEISHKKLHAEQELEVRRSKEIIDQLEKEKLEAEVKFKNQELASTTMNLVQKSEFLSSIRDALQKMKERESADDGMKKEIKRIVRLIDNDISLQEDWEYFSRNFDQVHSDFLQRLGEQYPNLSPNDFKLCAYLRMNLSSKEIASLMNISVRGVEASRYRLRKRIGLPTTANLTEFLLKL